jgi:uncharacterized protein YbjT (DUF2867 family)
MIEEGVHMTILVTGATGYIGSHLAQRLIAQGERPRCLVRDPHKAASILPAEKIELVQGNTTMASSLTKAVQGVDTIIHAAFMTADRKQTPGNRYEEINVHGTNNLIRAAREAGVPRVIEISGLGTKPDKPGSYMQGRYLAEKMLIDSDLAWTIIRPSVIFGHDAPFIKGLTNLIHSSPVLPLIGGGKVMFQPIYVEDVVTVIMKVLETPERSRGKIYTIGGPEYYTFTQVFDELLRAMHVQRSKVYAPTLFVGLGAAVMEAVLPHPPLTRAAMTLFSFDNITDLKSVEQQFGFKPTSFHQYLTEHGV